MSWFVVCDFRWNVRLSELAWPVGGETEFVVDDKPASESFIRRPNVAAGGAEAREQEGVGKA